jgi:hypothetical protein
MKICIVSVFKNENHILKEWLDHYINEGVDTFLLTDNGSTDDYISTLQPYIQSGHVILKINPKKHAQTELLNVYLKDAKKFDWVIIVDLDEFIYARKGFTTIKEYLQTLPDDVHKIYIPWKMFGSSGLKTQPTSVIQNFIHRREYPNKLCHTCYDVLADKKSIIRGKQLKEIKIHNSIIHTKSYTITPDNLDINNKDYYQEVTESQLKNSFLHLNHYRIQSWEWFKKNKINRTDAANKKNVRDKKYFNFFDYKDMIDTELKNKKYKKNKTKKHKTKKNKTVKIKFF